MADSFATRARLDVNGISYTYASLAKLGERFDLAKLPYAMKILLENLLRHEDGGITVGRDHIEAAGSHVATASMWSRPPNRRPRSPSCRHAWSCRTSPASLAWSTWRRCAMR